MIRETEAGPYTGRITADCHIHTEFSTDSETKITDQVERAIELGLDHICFTDHMDMDYPEGEFDLDTDAYVKLVLSEYGWKDGSGYLDRQLLCRRQRKMGSE